MSLPQHVLHLSHTHSLARGPSEDQKGRSNLTVQNIAAKIGLQFWGMHLLLKFQGKPQVPGPCSLPQTPVGRYSKVQRDQKITKKAFFPI
ncbi:hypothetical protein E4U58_000902 [Claviceps cyperi]|nr:hypothetical protein E4U58_000902 [Claviceps cyperi]